MAQITLVCTKCTPSSNGGFILTWKNQIVTPLGIMFPASGTGKSFCTKSATKMPLETQATIDLDQWEIQESEPFTGDDGEEHTTKWLKPRG